MRKMKDAFSVLWERLRLMISPVSNDLGTVCLGVAVVFFTRSFPSPYFQNVDFWMLIVSALFCIIGLMLRKGDNSD